MVVEDKLEGISRRKHIFSCIWRIKVRDAYKAQKIQSDKNINPVTSKSADSNTSANTSAIKRPGHKRLSIVIKRLSFDLLSESNISPLSSAFKTSRSSVNNGNLSSDDIYQSKDTKIMPATNDLYVETSKSLKHNQENFINVCKIDKFLKVERNRPSSEGGKGNLEISEYKAEGPTNTYIKNPNIDSLFRLQEATKENNGLVNKEGWVFDQELADIEKKLTYRKKYKRSINIYEEKELITNMSHNRTKISSDYSTGLCERARCAGIAEANGRKCILKKDRVKANEDLNMSIANIKKCLNISAVSFSKLRTKSVVKIAEASFSDVYLVDGLIYKIIPLADSENTTTLDNFYRECYLFKTIAGQKGVIRVKECFIVTGKYGNQFIKAWNDFRCKIPGDNLNPSDYKSNQVYGVMVMKRGGDDFEAFEFANEEEIISFIFKTVKILMNLERKFEFEHRDLHWGNLLISRAKGKIRVSIIDFSLSKLRADGNLIFSDLAKKQWLFEGDEKIDEQFGIYRKLRKLCGNKWSRDIPRSNLIWVRYLINKAKTKLTTQNFVDFLDRTAKYAETATTLRDFYKRIVFLFIKRVL